MVVFTCNQCGESLQKPKVEKHYFTVCKRARKSLTCVDCLKDFLDEEYVAHTKCITEEERYAAKGSFIKGVVKKGEVKQESWTEVIQSVIENTTNAKPGQQQILKLLSSSTNVPRKKNKFMNFVKNALSRKISDGDIEEVWNMIEKYKQQTRTPTTASEESEMAKENLQIENGNQANVPANESIVESSKKWRKSRNLEENDKEVVKGTFEKISKKKKPKNVEENVNEFNTPAERDDNKGITGNEISVESLKKKKKKIKNVKKNGSHVLEDKDELNVEVAVNKTAVETSENKKKPKVVQENHDATIAMSIEDDEVNASNDVIVESSKKNKRKSKNLNEDRFVENANSTSNVEGEMEPCKTKKKKSEIVTEYGIAPEEQFSQQTSVHSEEPTVNGTAENTRTKKRKLKNSGTEDVKESEIPKVKMTKTEIANNEAVSIQTDGKQQNSDAPSSNFLYKEKILEVLKTKNNISLNKLRKKVLDAYQKFTGTEPSEKIIKRFNKHLKKVCGIEISENNVRLLIIK